jgi:integrase
MPATAHNKLYMLSPAPMPRLVAGGQHDLRSELCPVAAHTPNTAALSASPVAGAELDEVTAIQLAHNGNHAGFEYLYHRHKRAFRPYIFSRSEITTLLRKCPEIQNHELSQITPETFQLLVILLYSTGIFVNEALSLRVSDLDFDNAVMTLSARAGSARTIPIIRQLNALLRRRVRAMRPDELLFQTKRGSSISIQRIDIHFRRVRAISGVARNDSNKYQPLLRDLRHTFAVNRICDWYRKKQSKLQATSPRTSNQLRKTLRHGTWWV